jgi:pimeloyl-ACP methyl ester carboxylesterase
MPTRFVDRMAVEIDGEGDAVLMIHGLGGTSNVWTPVMPAFARCLTLRPDLPGSGRSDRVEGPLSIERFVQALRRVAAAVGVERAHVVAHSLGTIVAFHLAAAEPRFVRSLALFGPLLAPADAIRPGIRTRGEKARSEGATGMQEIANTLVQAATASETRTKRPLACDALADAQPADTAKIACPTLLVTGDEDAIAPAGSVRQIAERLPGCRLEILRGCGHWTTIEKAEECSDLLRRFYEANRR